MTGVSLYTLRTEYQALLDKLSDGDFDEQTIADTIESTGLAEAFSAKVQNVVLASRIVLQNVPAIDAEIERLKALKAIREKASASLLAYVLDQMQEIGIERVESPLMTVSIRKNPESVDVFDDRMVPVAFMRQPPPPDAVPDKTAIKAALKAGKDVPGTKLKQSVRLHIQ